MPRLVPDRRRALGPSVRPITALWHSPPFDPMEPAGPPWNHQVAHLSLAPGAATPDGQVIAFNGWGEYHR